MTYSPGPRSTLLARRLSEGNCQVPRGITHQRAIDMRRLITFWVHAVVVWCSAATLSATTIAAFHFTDPPAGQVSVQGNDAFEFTPTQNLLVTALGYYDRNQDGLALQHQVAIYAVATDTQLAVATLGPLPATNGGFSTPFFGPNFTYEQPEPLTLYLVVPALASFRLRRRTGQAAAR